MPLCAGEEAGHGLWDLLRGRVVCAYLCGSPFLLLACCGRNSGNLPRCLFTPPFSPIRPTDVEPLILPRSSCPFMCLSVHVHPQMPSARMPLTTFSNEYLDLVAPISNFNMLTGPGGIGGRTYRWCVCARVCSRDVCMRVCVKPLLLLRPGAFPARACVRVCVGTHVWEGACKWNEEACFLRVYFPRLLVFLGKACPNVRCFLIPSNRRFNDSAATGGGVKPSFIRYHFGYCWHMSLPPAHAALLCAQ